MLSLIQKMMILFPNVIPNLNMEGNYLIAAQSFKIIFKTERDEFLQSYLKVAQCKNGFIKKTSPYSKFEFSFSVNSLFTF